MPVMEASEVTIGMYVRYPRTGTTGKVEHLEQVDHQVFASLDSTHLLYRVDQLIPVGMQEERKKREEEDIRKVIERERELAATLHDEKGKTDEMCDGGG